MSDNSSASVPPEDGGSGPSLLWIPYFSLTIVLLLMALASFINYHIKNREKYQNEKTQKEVRQFQKKQPKYRVTLSMKGAFYENHNRRSIKPSLDSNSTVTTSLDSGDTAGLGSEQLGNHFTGYQNAAFAKSDHSLSSMRQDVFSVHNEKNTPRKSITNDTCISNGIRRGSSAQLLDPIAHHNTESRHLDRPYTSPLHSRNHHNDHLNEQDTQIKGSSYWESSTKQQSSMVAPPNGMTSPHFKVYFLDNMILHLASIDKRMNLTQNSTNHHSFDQQISNETQSTQLSEFSEETAFEERGSTDSRELTSISSYSTYV